MLLLLCGISSINILQLQSLCKSLKQDIAKEENLLSQIWQLQSDIQSWRPDASDSAQTLASIKSKFNEIALSLSVNSRQLKDSKFDRLLFSSPDSRYQALARQQFISSLQFLAAAHQREIDTHSNLLSVLTWGQNFALLDALLGLCVAAGIIVWSKYVYSKPLKELLLQKKLEDERQARDQIQKSKQEIEEKNQELETLLYSVTHDLRTPVVSISGFASLLLEDYQDKLDQEALTYLQRIKSNTRHMEKLILDLLELSRVGRVPFNPEAVQVKELLQEVLIGYQQTLEKKKIKIMVQDDLPTIYCDHYKMAQVFSNLISNAIKYIGDDNPNPQIDVGLKHQDAGYLFHVKDNGIGIDLKYKDKIFQVFQRLDVIHTEGTGIGLAIVKKIVEKHAGRVWLESAPGQGCTFYVFIPDRKKPVEKCEEAAII